MAEPSRPAVRVVVPVKELDTAKSRLSEVLPSAYREGLVLAMLSDVLAALAAAGLADVDVLSPDRRVLGFAAACGARPLAQPPACATLAQAVDAAAASVSVDSLLVVHADVPLATAAELTALVSVQDAGQLDDGGGPMVVVAPDRAGRGTNALLRRPPRAIPALFGPDSLVSHLAAARVAGVPCRVRAFPGLAHDLDTPADLARFRASSGGTHTREFLRRLGDA